MKLLWLDDERNPHKNDWLNFSPIPRDQITEVIWVKNFVQFVYYISNLGLPDGICFDHDLGVLYPVKRGVSSEEEIEEFLKKPLIEMETGSYREGTIEFLTGYDCAKWLIEYCIDNDLKLPLYSSQSANPVGRENILCLLNNYKKYHELNL